MNVSKYILAAVFIVALAALHQARQAPGGRESSPTTEPGRQPPTEKDRPAGRRPRIKGKVTGRRQLPPATAALSLSVNPIDSTIYLRDTDYRAENGLFTRDGLTPGTYRVIVRRDGYRDWVSEVALGPGDWKPLHVSLEPLPGILSVTPLVAGAEIQIISSATGRQVGTYVNSARQIQLTPGRYQVLVSKEGYRASVREVSVVPAGSIFLEPTLIPVPAPPAPRRPPAPAFRRDYATRAQVDVEGKFLVVTLTGRSGDAANEMGALDVTLSAGGSRAQVVSVGGILTGYPCQVDFVRLENVAEYSFVEPPGAANQWARAVVRVRPKESKRPTHFLINWKSLRSLAPDGPPFN